MTLCNIIGCDIGIAGAHEKERQPWRSMVATGIEVIPEAECLDHNPDPRRHHHWKENGQHVPHCTVAVFSLCRDFIHFFHDYDSQDRFEGN
jgi:hypothetical protein